MQIDNLLFSIYTNLLLYMKNLLNLFIIDHIIKFDKKYNKKIVKY